MIKHCLCTAAVGLVACSGAEPGPVQDPARTAALTAQAVERVFAPGVDPSTPVVRCGTSVYTAAHLAVWLDVFPRLTVEQAAEDLADLCAVATARPTPGDSWAEVRRDAEQNARAMAWIRHVVHLDRSLEPTADAVAEFVANPENATLLGTPRLCVASHVLLMVGEQTTAEGRALAERVAGEVAATLRAQPGPVDVFAIAAAVEPRRAELEAAGLTIRVETEMMFPQQYSGAPTWDGLAAVVEPFAAATFGSQPGELFGPTVTEFGVHLGVVERFVEAVEASDAEQAQRARDILLARARAAAMGERSAAVIARTEILFDAAAASLVTGDAATRMTAPSAPD